MLAQASGSFQSLETSSRSDLFGAPTLINYITLVLQCNVINMLAPIECTLVVVEVAVAVAVAIVAVVVLDTSQ